MYDIGIKLDLGDFFNDTDTPNFNTYVENEGFEEAIMPEADANMDYDSYIESEVILPRNGKEMSLAKVFIQIKDENGKLKGTYNNKSILDTRMYAIMFPHGAVYEYEANIIAENIYSKVDSNGHRTLLLKEDTDHMIQQWLYL